MRNALLALAWIALLATSASAAPDPVPPVTPSPAAPAPTITPTAPAAAPAMTPSDLDAFFEGFLPFALKQGDVAGAVVTVVKDGQIIFKKGYGYADLKTEKPVDPDKTLFRIGSVSKLFTWTAVMQLVEQGKIDLDRDINDYLDFKIPATFPKPITMRNMMTHTTGFEEVGKGLWVTKDRPITIEQFVKQWVPSRIFPPGEVGGYSNYATTLAGYIVQRVSGESFEQYIENHIYAPLKMTRASFRQPLPDNLKDDLSTGYLKASGPEYGFEYIGVTAAGSMMVTGPDIAHFMIAHLNDGAYEGAQILKPETAVLMHTEAFRPIPTLNGQALGFFREDRNGHSIIGHSGDTYPFHADLHLVLDQHVGFFVAFNSLGTGPVSAPFIRRGLFKAFVDRYFPQSPAEQPTLATAHEHGLAMAGWYQTSRRAETTPLTLGALFAQFHIVLNPDDTISILPLVDSGTPMHSYREVAPYTWREVHGDLIVAAQVKDGHVVQWANSNGPPLAAQMPVPSLKSAAWNFPVLVISIFVLVLTLVLWPVAALVRWNYGQAFPLSGRQATLFRLIRLACLADLVFIVGWSVILVVSATDVSIFGPPIDPWLRGLQLLALIGAVGAVLALYNFGLVLVDGERKWWTKVTTLVIALALLDIAWFAFTFKMMTLSLSF